MNLWCLLLRHPDQFDAVMADSSNWDRAFHEMLRHSSSIGGQPRQNTFDIEMHGVHVPAGSLMQMVDFSANHDERIFKDPESFNIFRDDLYFGKLCSHMAFGVGPHLCPGAWISHQETVEGSKILAEHMKNVRIVEEKMPKDIDGVSPAPMGIVSVRDLWLAYDLT